MRKEHKIRIIIYSSVLTLMLLGMGYYFLYFPSDDFNKSLEGYKEICDKGGGIWASFGNSCKDSCKAIRPLGLNAVACRPIGNCWGCDCGPDKCWNEEISKCEPN